MTLFLLLHRLASSPAPDSVQITWNKGIPQATFTVINPDSLHQTGRFCWTPSAGSARTMPYSFVAKAKDNHCPNIASSSRNYNVFVTTKKTTTTNITALKCGSFILESNPDSTIANTAKYSWTLQDSNGKSINSGVYSFESTNGDTSHLQIDTVHINSNGTYILTHQIEPLHGNCPTIYFDTISVNNAFSIRTTRKNEILCKGDSQIWVANAKGGSSPYSYTWIYKNDTINSSSFTSLTTSYSENNTLILQVKEAGGCIKKLEAIVKTHPNNSNGFLPTYSACTNDSIVLTIDSSLLNPMWNASTSSYRQTYKTDSILVVNYSDTFQCDYSDTIRLAFYNSPPTSLSDTNACTDSIRLTPGFFASYLWNTGDTSASIVVNKSGLYYVQVWDRSNCTNTDTAVVTLNSKIPTPVIRLAHDTIFSNAIGKHYWHKDGNWISITTNNFFILPGFGEYFVIVQDTNGCISDTSNRLKKTAGFEDVISSKLIVYPNPSNGNLTLKLANLSMYDIKTIALYTTEGKQIESTVSKGENKFYITWNSAPGMLWLILQTDKEVYRQKIVYLK